MTLENQIVEILNNNGYDDLRTSADESDGSITLRNGYWDSIDPEILKEIETTFNVSVREMDDIWDDDCGQLYWYEVSLNDYSDDELMELEFMSQWEDGEELF